MEKKSYTFSLLGIKATQEELTIEQDYKLMELLSEVGIEEGQSFADMKISELIKKLVKGDLLSRLLDTILTVKGDSPNWKKLKNSELNEVIQDFFSLNPIALQLLRLLGKSAVIQNTNTTLSSSEPSVKSSTQDS